MRLTRLTWRRALHAVSNLVSPDSIPQVRPNIVLSSRTIMSSPVSQRVDLSLLTTTDVKEFISDLSYEKHKGQAGRIGVIGGCEEYTGAPYFAGISALKIGADLCHIFCTSEAALPIKSYSPDLIVHPILGKEDFSKNIEYWLPRIHCLVIGPGLGRNPVVLDNVKDVIGLGKKAGLPMVIDGDALFLVTQNLDLIKGYPLAILTPNLMEYQRLYKAVMPQKLGNDVNKAEEVIALSHLLEGVTVVKKGELDVITDSKDVTIVDEKGSPRRCGGQGDILAGSIGVFTHWALTAKSRGVVSKASPTVMGAFAGCLFLKKLNLNTFKDFSRCGNTKIHCKLGRSMVAADMIERIGMTFAMLYDL